ncbi:potassium-transporting ATPase subunit KdpC [Rhodoplanes sp. TEM]|uniref:Potassium-transporting ATPase KdpC subunit n=1 Tax=Rhodoplanes tepidamans TaxID=200616 RepID=A0ABT5J9I8_RHOTP|nr:MULTISPECIES: potassium-transporting ATPase subunit KdpC [Rhodoplanes]MDC7786332.1 potassium-transporting ATPase subunit KdpC [Rhodoplanes tepidamans]MDC7984709.1 potassium-transporting ATPase subunit KdpC [Rhodoplanes sp. TEM]MDQ0354075.1 K+-transporting ATPase ATPase C chain [Rhodoplanes tepidamans]
MLSILRPALVLLALFTLLTGVAYPLAVTGLARILAPAQAGGSLVVRDGAVVGSALIGQAFGADRYFHGRPSATTAPDPADPAKTVEAPYNAAASSGSNLAPSATALKEAVAARAAALGVTPAPADLVTASASGLDPHVSPQGALVQVARVAAARGLPEAAVRGLVERHVEDRTFGVLGEPRVNVLALNLALDALTR